MEARDGWSAKLAENFACQEGESGPGSTVANSSPSHLVPGAVSDDERKRLTLLAAHGKSGKPFGKAKETAQTEAARSADCHDPRKTAAEEFYS